MTKEALNLALEALELSHPRFGIGTAIHIKAVAVIKETLAQPEPNYKKALEVWLDKTEWVQETVKSHELGMHRADVLKQRIQEASPQRTWVGLTDEEVTQIIEMGLGIRDSIETALDKLNEKNESKN